jgi:hypothetical protein
MVYLMCKLKKSDECVIYLYKNRHSQELDQPDEMQLEFSHAIKWILSLQTSTRVMNL